MEEASWQKNHAEGIMEEQSCAGIMEKQSCTRYATQASSFLTSVVYALLSKDAFRTDSLAGDHGLPRPLF